MTELELAKKKLSDSLRDRMSKYWEAMKDWYKRKVRKEEVVKVWTFSLSCIYFFLDIQGQFRF